MRARQGREQVIKEVGGGLTIRGSQEQNWVVPRRPRRA